MSAIDKLEIKVENDFKNAREELNKRGLTGAVYLESEDSYLLGRFDVLRLMKNTIADLIAEDKRKAVNIDKALEDMENGGFVEVDTHTSVNHPSHYSEIGIEPIDIIDKNKLDFCKGNAIKYILRAGHKDSSKEIEDLEKAKWYINHEIELLKGDKK